MKPEGSRVAWDVVVAGAGVAGCALGVALAEQGLRVLVVDPDPARVWTQTFAAWLDEVPQEWSSTLDTTWAAPMVWFDGAEQDLARTYALLSTQALQRGLHARGRRAGWSLSSARVLELRPDGLRTTAGWLEAKVVVDATGLGLGLQEPRAFQTAYGVELEVSGHPFAMGEMVLMDLRSPLDLDGTEAPSFAYVLPKGLRRIFVEETCLVGAPGLDEGTLRRRLQGRLDALGLEGARAVAEERVRIPMDLPVAEPSTVLRFGAAAGMVHPATGYQVARTLSLAPAVAAALARGLRTGDRGQALRDAWDVVWPRDARRLWRLFGVGRSFLLTQDAASTQSFFRSFFSLPTSEWSAYVSARGSPKELATSMGRVFLQAQTRTQADLLWHGGAQGLEILRAVAP